MPANLHFPFFKAILSFSIKISTSQGLNNLASTTQITRLENFDYLEKSWISFNLRLSKFDCIYVQSQTTDDR